jgi:hypothetical protein
MASGAPEREMTDHGGRFERQPVRDGRGVGDGKGRGRLLGDSHSNRIQRPRFWSWGCRGALTLISLATTLARVTCQVPHTPSQPLPRTGRFVEWQATTTAKTRQDKSSQTTFFPLDRTVKCTSPHSVPRSSRQRHAWCALVQTPFARSEKLATDNSKISLTKLPQAPMNRCQIRDPASKHQCTRSRKGILSQQDPEK